ncbi:hypothetical protein ACV07N_11140 [Roseivirga echinicomitans]
MMLDEVISTVEQAKDLPAVKRVYQSEFIRLKTKQFEVFLNRIIRRNVKKAVAPTKRKLTLLNWLLINVVVFAYFAGKADAQSIEHLEYIYLNYTIIGLWAIIANICASVLLGIGKILRVASRITLQVFSVLIVVFFIYWVIKKVCEFFTKKEESQEELPIS